MTLYHNLQLLQATSVKKPWAEPATFFNRNPQTDPVAL